MMDWTDDKIALLRKLRCEEGMSYSKIGARLGCSRNAAVGKAHREGIDQTAPGRVRAKRVRPPRLPGHPRVVRAKPPRLPGHPRVVRAKNPVVRRQPRPMSPLQRMLVAALERAPAYVEPDVDGPLPGGKRLIEVEEGDCRWPSGDPRHDNFRLCAKRRVEGLPYCEHHARRAFAATFVEGAPNLAAGGQTQASSPEGSGQASNASQRLPEARDEALEKAGP